MEYRSIRASIAAGKKDNTKTLAMVTLKYQLNTLIKIYIKLGKVMFLNFMSTLLPNRCKFLRSFDKETVYKHNVVTAIQYNTI